MKLDKILLTEDQIAAKVSELGEKITHDYAGKKLLMICTLRGSVLFFADLIRHIKVPCQLDFISASSYGNETISTGKLNIKKDIETNIENLDVILVEDIVDTGITISALYENLKKRNPASLKVCAVFNKPSRRVCDVRVDYFGFEIPDEFVVGYGLDFAQDYRELPYLATLTQD